MRLVLAVLLVGAVALQADPAERFESTGDVPAAESAYRELLRENPGDPTVNYNLGTLLLIDGRFDEARPYLETAAGAPDSTLTPRSNYNLGNTDLQAAHDDPRLAERDERLRRAIDAYKRVLVMDPADEDARWNLEVARRLLESDPPPSSGGGGGGGSGGGQGPPEPGTNQPMPSPADGAGPEPDLPEAEAEALLDSARERELQVQRDRLQKPQTEPIRP